MVCLKNYHIIARQTENIFLGGSYNFPNSIDLQRACAPEKKLTRIFHQLNKINEIRRYYTTGILAKQIFQLVSLDDCFRIFLENLFLSQRNLLRYYYLKFVF